VGKSGVQSNTIAFGIILAKTSAARKKWRRWLR